MSEKQHTIGLSELLDEVDNDLADFRKKHPGDYSLKNITLWWEMERERLVTRHVPTTVVKTLRKAHKARWTIACFVAGWLTTLVAQSVIRLAERLL